MPFLPATLIGGLLAMLVALLVGLSLMRLSGPYVAVATMGFLVIVQVILVNWDKMTRGARTFAGVPPYTTLWWVWGWAVLTVYVVWRLARSAYGRRMMAIRDNEIAAQSLGISVMRSRLLAFCISAFFTGRGRLAVGALHHVVLAQGVLLRPDLQHHHHAGRRRHGLGERLDRRCVSRSRCCLRCCATPSAASNLGFVQIPPIYGASQILMAVICSCW